MRRIVSVWFPAFAIDRLRRAAPSAVPAERAFALIETGARGLVITAVNAPARRQGLQPGLALADARAAFPDLATRPAEPARDAATLAGLAQWVGRYGPLRNIDGADGLWIDVTGVAHLYGGEAALVRDLRRRLAALGFSASVAMATTLGAAHALARAAPPDPARRDDRIVPPQETAAALAALPVAALRIEADAVVLLQRLGLYRIGQLYDLPRAALARRFREGQRAKREETVSAKRGETVSAKRGERVRARPGAQGKGQRTAQAHERLAGAVLGRLDQALGRSGEPRVPLAEPPSHAARQLFADPLISSAGIDAALTALAQDLCTGLAAQAQGARRFELALYRADGTWVTLVAGASAPCRDAAHITRLLTHKLAGFDAGFGVDALVLAAGGVEPMAAAQVELAAPSPASDTALLVDRLSNRLGAARVLRLAPVASHLPERAQRLMSALAHTHADRQAEAPANVPPPPRMLRPPFLLPAPEPITVVAEVPEGAPARFTWRRMLHAIVHAEGPERIAPEWWRELACAEPSRPRDYYRIEDATGGRFWVFRDGLYQAAAEQGTPRWFMHGIYG